MACAMISQSSPSCAPDSTMAVGWIIREISNAKIPNAKEISILQYRRR
jgi:hypothetical protein